MISLFYKTLPRIPVVSVTSGSLMNFHACSIEDYFCLYITTVPFGRFLKNLFVHRNTDNFWSSDIVVYRESF